MALRPPEVTIHGERGAEYEKLLGRRTFRVKSPLPCRADLPGRPDAEVYLLDIDALRPGELDTLAKHVAAKFSVPYEIVLSEMRDCGVPILAEDCSCAMDLRMFI
jgi:hypothetical protein